MPILQWSNCVHEDQCELFMVLIYSTQEGEGRSILDKDKIAHRILEMAGKKMHSEGLREEKDADD